MESRWKRKVLSRWSSALCDAPSKVAQEVLVEGSHSPAATGTNKCELVSNEYLFFFCRLPPPLPRLL